MRILITGGAGFIGSHLCDRLLADDHDIIAIDNLSTGSEDNIAHLDGHERFSFVKQDVTDYISVAGPLDAVLHLASLPSPVDYLNYPIQHREKSLHQLLLQQMFHIFLLTQT